MSIDPRDLFVRLNPLGLEERDLEKDNTGFADSRTHGDYLIFLSDYKAGTVDGGERECQRQHPINVEGCKPDHTITLPVCVRGCHSVAREVLTERIRQITVEGYTAERDDQYTTGQLADAPAPSPPGPTPGTCHLPNARTSRQCGHGLQKLGSPNLNGRCSSKQESWSWPSWST